MKYTNYYHCSDCNEEWSDDSECMNNDKCPECGSEIEPHESVDIIPESKTELIEKLEKVINKSTGTDKYIQKELRVQIATAIADFLEEGAVLPENLLDYQLDPDEFMMFPLKWTKS